MVALPNKCFTVVGFLVTKSYPTAISLSTTNCYYTYYILSFKLLVINPDIQLFNLCTPSYEPKPHSRSLIPGGRGKGGRIASGLSRDQQIGFTHSIISFVIASQVARPYRDLQWALSKSTTSLTKGGVTQQQTNEEGNLVLKRIGR